MGTVRRQKAKAERLFKSACEFYDKNDFQKAASLFEGLLSEDAGVCRIQDLELWLAACYLELSDYQKAGPLLDKLMNSVNATREPLSYAHVLSLSGQCHSYSGAFEAALTLLEELEQYAQTLLQEGEVWLLFNGRTARAFALLELGKPNDALGILDLAESVVPTGTMPHAVKAWLDHDRAVALHRTGDHQRALQLLQAIDPDSLHGSRKQHYWFYRTRLHEWIKEHDKSLIAFKTLEALGIPDSLIAEAHHWAGRAYYYSGKGPEAVRHFRESLKHATDCAWVEESSLSHLDELKKVGWV